MSGGRRPPWWMGAAVVLGAWALRLLGRTWRIERIGTAERDARIAAGEGCIFALWHARLLALVYTHRGLGVAVMVSRSRDGELITGVIERLGYVTARGSSTRGGGEAMLALLERSAEGRVVAFTPDGPRGPVGQVKPGLAWLASRTGLPVIPVAAAARSTWALRSWDRFRVPRPFARVVVAYGEPLRVPAAVGDADLETWRARIERAIEDHTRTVVARAGEEPA